MTRKRNDKHSTEFGLWLREQDAISSSTGYIATNLDYIWSNYKTGEWMFLEEKRYNTKMTWAQEQQFKMVDEAVDDERYRGFHLIVFEKTSPDDGAVYVDYKNVTTDELLMFLQFRMDDGCYTSLFKKDLMVKR